MSSRKVTFKPNNEIEKCPKCGNNTEFVVKSNQVCEDGCEIWAVCKCGYDPTEHSYGCRIEDVWGTIDKYSINSAISVTWNGMIQDANSKTSTT